MANAKRPGVNKDESPMAPAIWMDNPTYQPHNNMAPFTPAPVEYDTVGGHYSRNALNGTINTEEEGTGKF